MIGVTSLLFPIFRIVSFKVWLAYPPSTYLPAYLPTIYIRHTAETKICSPRLWWWCCCCNSNDPVSLFAYPVQRVSGCAAGSQYNGRAPHAPPLSCGIVCGKCWFFFLCVLMRGWWGSSIALTTETTVKFNERPVCFKKFLIAGSNLSVCH